MTGPDVPDDNERDPNDSPEGDLPDAGPLGPASPEEAWDWLDLGSPDGAERPEPMEQESDPVAFAEGPRPVVFSDGPAARNGQNGHSGLAGALRAPARRPSGKSAARRPRHAPWPLDDALIVALSRAAMKADDGEEASLIAASIAPLIFGKTVPASRQDAIRPVLPALMKGVAVLVALLVDEDARRLIHLLPSIIDETFRTLARAADEGQPVTRKRAGDVLAEKTATAIARSPGRLDENARRTRGERRPSAPHWYSEETEGDDGNDAF